MKARPYQTRAIDGALEAFKTHQSVLLVMPTGCGKTVVFSHIIDKVLEANPGKRAMVVAHREELIHQAAEKLHAVTGITSGIEMAELVADSNMFDNRLVVASVQSLNAKRGGKPRLHRFDPRDFAIIVIDEAHHATAKSYRAIQGHFQSSPTTRLLGVTATPDRQDETALGTVFKACAFDYDMAHAIRDGWLTPIKQQIVYVNGLNYDNARVQMGDLSAKDIAKAQSSEQTLHAMVVPMIEAAGDRRTIVFSAAGKQAGDDPFHIATRIEEIIGRYKPGLVARVSQDTEREKRRQILKDFASGKLQYVVNVGVLTEGFDDPGVSCVAVMRPTLSRSLYCQMIGRGTRPVPGVVDAHEEAEARRIAIAASAKPDLLVLDFEGRNCKHKLVHTTDVLAGNEPPEVLAKVKKQLEKQGGGDPLEVLEEIKEAEEKRRINAEKRRALKVATIEYDKQERNPFQAINLPPMEVLASRNDPPTMAQLHLIRKLGFPIDVIKSRKQASAVIEKLIERKSKGLTPYPPGQQKAQANASAAAMRLIGAL